MKKLIDIEVSVFKPTLVNGVYQFGTRPETLPLAYTIGFNHQPDLISQIRLCKDLDEVKKLKAGLWMITPSAVCEGGRSSSHIIQHTGLMQFDIDKIEGNITEYFNFIKQIPYVAYCGLSASGKGLWGLIPIAYPEKHKQHFDAMEKAFYDVGINIDPAPKAVNSARFLSYDKNHHWNPQATIFDKVIEPVKEIKEFKPIASGGGLSSPKTNLIDWFNRNCTAADMDEILLNFGFNFHSSAGQRYRYTRPNKNVEGGLSVDYHEDKKTLFSFSSEVPQLNYWKQESQGWSCSPMTALLVYGCGGMDKQHWRTAFEYIKSKTAA